MIPKKIHYFWFSDDPFPENIKKCMDSWRQYLSEYEIIKWDLSNTPIECEFAEKALAEKKWAFLSDYARLRILSEHGGIYLDTDVLVVKTFDDLLSCDSFWGRAQNGMVEPVVIGARPNNEIVRACLAHFMLKSGEDLQFKEIPLEIEGIFEKEGFEKSNTETQIFEKALVFSYDYFCPMPFEQAEENPLSFVNENTYAVHLWNAAWFDPFRFFWNGRRKKGWEVVIKTFLKNPFQNLTFYRNVFYHLRKSIFGYDTIKKTSK